MSSARLASVEDDKVAVRYFAVRVENQAATSSRVAVVVNGAGREGSPSGRSYTRFGLRARAAPDGGCWSLSVFVDREVSPQGDGSCPGEVRS